MALLLRFRASGAVIALIRLSLVLDSGLWQTSGMAAMEQLQQQMIELEQRTRLAEQALMASQAQVGQMNTQLQQQSGLQAAMQAARTGQQSMVDMRLLGKPDKWDGTDSR